MTDTAETTDHDPSLLVVETDKGRIRGEHRRGAYRFKGIPYAAAPVGDRRFAPPVPAESWTDIRPAVGRFPVAPQPPDMVSQLLGAGEGPAQSEAACLSLNVWTPAPDGARRPVLVWIHGGAFVSGNASVPWYDGANLSRRDVVVVTINYRLGALGFCYLEQLGGDAFAGSGNVGILDQTAALRWVRDNIEAFGGDPDNVTIFGESAGGMSVGTHLASPGSKGLFHRALAQSGAVDNVSGPDRATDVARRVLKELDLAVNDLDQLRKIPAAALVAAQEQVSAAFGITNGLPFQPVWGDDVIPRRPIDAIAQGDAAGIDLIVGSNRDELRVFISMTQAMATDDDQVIVRRLRPMAGPRAEEIVAAYRRLRPDATPTDLFEAIGTDAVFRIPALRLAEAQRPHAPCRVYEFHQSSTGLGGNLGASHAVDVAFTFDNLDAPGAAIFTGDPDEGMRFVATSMADAWCAFARNGDPNNPALPHWPTWQAPDHATMLIDGHPRVVEDPAGPQRQIWHTST